MNWRFKLSKRLAISKVALLMSAAAISACTSDKSLSDPVPTSTSTDSSSIASLHVTPRTDSLGLGATAQLVATVLDTHGNALSVSHVAWSTTQGSVASVSSSGVVTGVAAGATDLIATVGAFSDTVEIVVVPAAVPPPTSQSHSGWFASGSGSASGDGSINNPWALPVAFAGGNGKIQPGDTLWIRGGTYTGVYTPTLTGRPDAWIVVRQYPGERATFDGVGLSPTTDQFVVSGSYAQYMDFEIINSSPSRYTTDINHNFRHAALVNHAPHNRYVDLILHDNGTAVYMYSAYADVELTGNLIYNNGWDAPDRGHGHGIYAKNDVGPVLLKDNVLFDQYGYGIHAYSDNGDGLLNGITIDGNISFNSGSVSAVSASANIGNLGQPTANNMQIVNNLAYFSPGVGGANLVLGSGNGLLATGNTVIGGSGLSQGAWTSATIGSNSVWPTGNGSATTVVRPNSRVPGRANIAVYNPSGALSVSVSMSGVLNAGDSYTVRNVYDMYGAPVASGTYAGGAITIPITGMNPPMPLGGTTAPPQTGTTFAVFVVTKN